MAEPFNDTDRVRKTYFINESEKSVDPTDDEGKVVQLENDGKLSPEFIPTIPLEIQEFTASGTWTKPERGTMALVELIGAGASGGTRFGGSVARVASGGGGGEYIRFFVPLSALSATEAVTIGAGGSSRVQSSAGQQVGADGGSTQFKGVSAKGGKGGLASSGISSPIDGGDGALMTDMNVFSSESGGDGGTAGSTTTTDGTNTFFAGAGGGAARSSATPTQSNGGTSSFTGSIGGVGAGANSTTPATATAGTKGGGGGGAATENATATSGKGGDGYVRITVF